MEVSPTLVACIPRSLLPIHGVQVARRSPPTLPVMLLPSGSLVVAIDVSIVVGIHVVARVGDAVAGIGVIRKASAAGTRLAGVRVPRYSRRAAVDHASGRIV